MDASRQYPTSMSEAQPNLPPGTSRRRQRRWALLSLTLGLALLGLFGLRTWHQADYAQRVRRGELQVESVRGWMTLSYIAQTYGVPEAELRAALGVPAEGFEQRSLKDWFKAAQLEPAQGRERIEALIVAHRAEETNAGRPRP
jgi:hypothetical protein